AGIGHEKLVAARNMMLGMAMGDKSLTGVRPNALDDAPQLKIDVDQDKARALGLDLSTVNSTISTAWGGS
ncbi:efflux RND transporter permease subunit, partial [Escherichia coli]|nr:efflux RND transporter permease subunit [Escherichia coli]